ncbi:hypothetical protein QWI17_12280 [Gilvimarinus sp. SDUM040013]|uniref:Peptidase M61 catalytic domain-containing protein n=1 Tax=Gilvimarinus gilvus TaxID=3058038 RepID=A0ABU4S0W5_9GAMM|nr:hypothetical protein [Gilvimarinus sp. SDUM040013]MDO3386615.1 hypothetical protein [Gilvimarinus sp. SDUM040013]MDX6849498.1 hypothetical protein [Gilvimarinus sp. SDUM040013]
MFNRLSRFYKLLPLAFASGILLFTQDLAAQDYELNYHADFTVSDQYVRVTISLPDARPVKSIDFNLDSDFHSEIEANGELELNDGRALWQPPTQNAKLELHVALNHERDPGEYDSIRRDDFAIFRGDDLIPPARVRTIKGATSKAQLSFTIPDAWNSVNSGWPKQADDSFVIDDPDRRFDRPTGWFIAGELGTRRERLSDTHIAVSAPQSQGVRRMDVMSFVLMNWPQFRELLGKLPEKVLIVSAADPMWRGGLSGPNSLFFHADRPMVSENGTSTLLHELFHTLTSMTDKGNDDWIVEGLAEYYSVEILYRSAGLSDARRQRVFNWLADWGKDIEQLRGRSSSGEQTARAVVLLEALALEIEQKTDGNKSLDDVTRALVKKRKVDLDDLRRSVTELLGEPSDTLQSDLLK